MSLLDWFMWLVVAGLLLAYLGYEYYKHIKFKKFMEEHSTDRMYDPEIDDPFR